MSVRTVARRQYQKRVDDAATGSAHSLSVPPEGWIATVRKALGISGAQLGRMTGRTRATIAGAERSERDRAVTLQTMDVMAKAMGCRFVYAIIPETGSAGDVVEAQARKKARALVDEASRHMALEDQAIAPDRLEEEIEQIAGDLVREPPADFWQPE
tara:strand:- start:860 stop:1330 length:471 start_codon:yes stop_codon:yes gene_type:complete